MRDALIGSLAASRRICSSSRLTEGRTVRGVGAPYLKNSSSVFLVGGATIAVRRRLPRRRPIPPSVRNKPTSVALATRVTRSVVLRFDEKALFGTPNTNVKIRGPRKNMNTIKRVQNATMSSAGQKLRNTERAGGSITKERIVLSPRLPSTPR
jgi:hypothetical protein